MDRLDGNVANETVVIDEQSEDAETALVEIIRRCPICCGT
jgi:hypothetical protein